MGFFAHTSNDKLSYKCNGWYIKFRLPFTIDNMHDSPFDIEKTRASNCLKCLCGSDYRTYEVVSECQIADYPVVYLFNTKEEALEKFNIMLKAYGRNLKYEDIFVSIHHCEIEQKFTYIEDFLKDNPVD